MKMPVEVGTFQDRVPLFVVWTKSVRVCYLFLIA